MDNILERASALSPERRALLARMLGDAAQENARQNKIPRQPRQAGVNFFPLSFAQQRLWFLDQLDPGNAAYNGGSALQLRGSLDKAALEWSLNQVVQRHETLRTTFALSGGQPVQVIAPALTLPLPLIDLRLLSEAERLGEAHRLASQASRQPFDLARGPLLRVTLLRLQAGHHVLLLAIHHVISDGWSIGIFLSEIAALYRAFCQGQPSPLPELPVQYADLSVWQREWLSGQIQQEQLAYWQRQLAHAPAALELPTDRPRPPIHTFRGATWVFWLPQALTQTIKTLSQQKNVTLFMTLLAAFQALLARYSGQHDISVGTPIANRNRPEIGGLIGLFLNTLILRTDLSGRPSLEELIQRARRVALEAYAHQDLPFEMLVEALQPARNLSRTPLFQVMFVLHNAPMGELALPGLTLSTLEIEGDTAQFDLTLSTIEIQDRLLSKLEYNTDLFDAATAARLAGHFHHLLRAAAYDPQRPLADISLLSEAENHQLLLEWNDSAAPYPLEARLHQLIETQAARVPDAVAIACEAQQLTYRQLDRRANQLARRLQAHGVGPDVLVAICVERTPDMLIGLLGILKAGGAYVPLDPTHPQERLAGVLEDVTGAQGAAPILLSQQRLLAAGTLPPHTGRPICLDADWPAIAAESQAALNVPMSAERLAYVIYTSGSTGRPKGVQVRHRAVVNLLHAMQRQPGLNAQDILLAITTLSFDIAGLELFLPLICGARIALLARQESADGFALAGQLTTSQASILQATPAAWQLLLESSWPGNPRLRALCGGESLPRKLADALLGRAAALWNMYGPTETTIWSAAEAVAADGALCIGRPIANTQFYLLDDSLVPAPGGVWSELYIGGHGLARGYLGRPALTAAQFMPHPFSREPGARLYRTGDILRYRPDGRLEFLGRSDHQVKIRGYRIELGEIEAALATHPAVRQAVALARQDRADNTQLTAYIVAHPGQEPTVSALHRFLRQKLPDYMLPSTFVLLDALPLTPNGKIDRRALPAPGHDRPALEKGFVAPRTPLEEMLAGVWAQVLSLAQVGVHDDFFELGGHSLLATQVIAQLRQALQIELPMRSLFEAPTVAGLAQIVMDLRLAQADAGDLALLHLVEGLSDDEIEAALAQMQPQDA